MTKPENKSFTYLLTLFPHWFQSRDYVGQTSHRVDLIPLAMLARSPCYLDVKKIDFIAEKIQHCEIWADLHRYFSETLLTYEHEMSIKRIFIHKLLWNCNFKILLHRM